MMTCEFVLLKDIDGDGTSEFLFKDSENKFVYRQARPGESDRDVDQDRHQRARAVGQPRDGHR